MGDRSTARAPGGSVLVISRCASRFGESRGGVDVLAARHAVALERFGSRVTLVSGSADRLSGVSRLVHVPPTRFLVSRGQPRWVLHFLVLLNEFVNVVRGSVVSSRLLRRERFDLVVSNHSITTLVVRFLHPDSRIVQYVHDGLHAHRHVRGIVGKSVRYLVNDVLEYVSTSLATHVFCASESIRDQLSELGVPLTKMSIVPPLVFATDAVPRIGGGAIIDPTDLQSFTPYVLSVGQQSGRKRFDVLISAMKSVDPETSLVLVGDGPLHEAYRRLARREGLEDRIVFLRGIDDAALRRLYSNSNLFALVSENEGFPVTVAEALSFGGRALLASPSVADWPETSQPALATIPEIPTPEALAASLNALLAVAGREPLGAVPLPAESSRINDSKERIVLEEYLRLLHRTVTENWSANATPTTAHHGSGPG